MGGLRPEGDAQAFAGRRIAAMPQRDHVEIEIVDARLVLRRVHDAEVGVDAEQLQVLDERLRVAFEPAAEIQELDAERLARGQL